MKLIFEKSGRRNEILPDISEDILDLPQNFLRKNLPRLPEISESEISRHYSKLSRCTYGVNTGFYPLGSCTMKYNPAINEETAELNGFANIHPLQEERTVQGALEVLYLTEKYLCEITGMDAINFQPAAGAHGELTALMMIKAYFISRGEDRNVIIVPDSAHGTNPASANMCGFKIINIPSAKNGEIDLEKLSEVVAANTAGLMLTNPNTLGIFETNASQIAQIIHNAGGLVYYDGANLNAIMGTARPGDMGFDILHLNLHKTFSTPHGGGGPGSGPVGCKSFLQPFLPIPRVIKRDENFLWDYDAPNSIGRIKSFYGNFLVVVKALTYIISLGSNGILETSQNAVLNANYLMKQLTTNFEAAFPGLCMHEFVLTVEKLKKQTGVSALDIAKSIIDAGFHPPTMYFPLIVHEALMFEPTETETKETLDEVADVILNIYQKIIDNPQSLHAAPVNAPVGRPDEAKAARNPILRYRY